MSCISEISLHKCYYFSENNNLFYLKEYLGKKDLGASIT